MRELSNLVEFRDFSIFFTIIIVRIIRTISNINHNRYQISHLIKTLNNLPRQHHHREITIPIHHFWIWVLYMSNTERYGTIKFTIGQTHHQVGHHKDLKCKLWVLIFKIYLYEILHHIIIKNINTKLIKFDKPSSTFINPKKTNHIRINTHIHHQHKIFQAAIASALLESNSCFVSLLYHFFMKNCKINKKTTDITESPN